MARLGALVVLAGAACAARPPAAPRPVGTEPLVTGSVLVGAAGTAPAPAVIARVLAAATERSNPERAAPAHAAALDEVARAAAASAAEHWVVASDAVHTAMGERLGSGLDPYVLTARGDDDAAVAQLAAAIGELRAAAGIATVGVAGVTGSTGRVIALVAMPPPIGPVAIERTGTIAHVRVPWPWPERPRAFDVTAGGSRSLDAVVRVQLAEVIVDCARVASRTIELDAGDTLVASVVDVCGPSPRPARPGADIGPPARTTVEIEQRLFELINRDRVAEGRAPIAWDARAQQMARGHAARMHLLAFMGHVAPDGENLTDRVRAIGLPAAETFENVGLIDGPGRAHLAFMTSPGHRANLLAVRARRGAVGVVPSSREPGWYYVTEVFFEPQR